MIPYWYLTWGRSRVTCGLLPGIEQAVAADRQCGGLTGDINDLVAARRPGDEGNVAASYLERVGHRAPRGLRGLSVDRPRADRDNKRVTMPTAHYGPRGSRFDADRYPHAALPGCL